MLSFRKPLRSILCATATVALVCLLAAAPVEAREKATQAPPAPTCTPPPIGEEVPESIAKMIRIAQAEVAATAQKKLPKNNKYTEWYFGDKRQVGWCSPFVSWCGDQAGLRLLKDEAAAPMPAGAVFITNEAKVVLTQSAYRKAERFTDIPKPGYEVIYGVIGGTSSTHVGLVESVKDLGNGKYEITTLEGNVSSTCKRYCYWYIKDPKEPLMNLRAIPKDQQTRNDAQYRLHTNNWFITGFGATW